MSLITYTLFSFILCIQLCLTQDCSFDGTAINEYYAGVSTDFAGGTVTVDRFGIELGALVMIIQMQGGDINNSDTANYGSGLGTGTGYTTVESGYYEFNVVINRASSGGPTSLGFLYPLEHEYFALGEKTFQVVTVPFCETAVLSSNITAPAWDGKTGGIVSLIARHAIIDTITVKGTGFRGGFDPVASGGGSSTTNYVDGSGYLIDSAVKNARKGEGFIGSPGVYDFPTSSTYFLSDGNPGDCARGAPGNAGGGGK